jgi:hypothetical protein
MKIENTTPTEAQIELASYLLTREVTFTEECEADPKIQWFAVASYTLEDIMGLTPYRSGYADIAEYEHQEDLIEAKEARKNSYYDYDDEQRAWFEKEEEAHRNALKELVSSEYKPLGVGLPL